MTPYEMEEQLTNLNARTTTIEQILPTLATKDDLRLTREALQDDLRLTREALLEDLRLTTAALRHEMATFATKDEIAKFATRDELNAGLEDAKRYALMLNEATRDDIRLLAEHLLAMRSQLDAVRSQLDRIERKRTS